MNYQPLTLKARKDGAKTGTVTSNSTGEPVEYIVVVSRSDMRYSIHVTGGDLLGAFAGVLTRHGNQFQINSAKANGKIEGRGYSEGGGLASCVERLVFEFLASVDYARREAAKTPEQKMREAEEREANLNAARNREIAKSAKDLMATLERLVPHTTIHYAVEDARRAMATLIMHAEKASIATAAAKKA